MRRLEAFIPLWFYPAIVLWSIVFFVWTFLKTDPNLYFSTQPLFVTLQQSAWQLAGNRSVVVATYVLLILVGFGLYLFAVKKQIKFSLPLLIVPLVVIASNVALSHDLFNYMFNAKALLQYQQDPHLKSALEIASTDEWLRFMHNVHTTAPYGKFWTYLTTAPFILGFSRFLPTYLSFKVFMAIGVVVLAVAQMKLSQVKNGAHKSMEWRWFYLNPLFLIETFSSGHNDVWMMAFVFVSFAILFTMKRNRTLPTIVSLLFLGLSTQIKLATITLIPVWVGFFSGKSLIDNRLSRFSSIFQRLEYYWADTSAFLLLLPLLTSRSQQFHPWYLIWALSFLPFIKCTQFRVLLLLLSLTSLLRYIPFLWVGEYSSSLLTQSQIITWSAVPIWMLVLLFIQIRERLRYNQSMTTTASSLCND